MDIECYNPIEQKMHNELGYNCDGEWHYDMPEVKSLYRTEMWKKYHDEGDVTAFVKVNETWNTVEVTYELFAQMMVQLGFEKDPD